jgi:hypothetical protein
MDEEEPSKSLFRLNVRIDLITTLIRIEDRYRTKFVYIHQLLARRSR